MSCDQNEPFRGVKSFTFRVHSMSCDQNESFRTPKSVTFSEIMYNYLHLNQISANATKALLLVCICVRVRVLAHVCTCSRVREALLWVAFGCLSIRKRLFSFALGFGLVMHSVALGFFWMR